MNPQNTAEFIFKSLSMHGFVNGFGDVMTKAVEGFMEEATKLVLDGRIKNREMKYAGVKEAGQALADHHVGKNFGKSVIIVADK